MGWLIGPTLFSLFAAIAAVKLFDIIFAGATGTAVGIARAGVFVATWAAVTAQIGMRGFRQKMRQLRQGTLGAIKALAKGEKLS